MAATPDPFTQFKAVQREFWALFAPLENMTTIPAAWLVRFAEIRSGQTVLDVACGTGVVAVTAARTGAKTRGLDLTPTLLERANENAKIAGLKIEFTEGDAEALPYPDASFDVVLSQFGHMFAPRPEVAVSEMLRVLRPGGRIAFSTWPPEMFIGRMFGLVGKYMPPPQGVSPPGQWGDPNIVRQRLGDHGVTDLLFDRQLLSNPALSPQHYRQMMETTAGPLIRLIKSLEGEPEQLGRVRAELDALISEYFANNIVSQHFLITRANKRA